jgi:formate C-acetyltransferase
MLDGRKAGEPVSKNANPTLDALSANPTGQILSAAALPQTRYSGGQPIDLYFDRNQLSTQEQRDKIRAFLLTYFSLGGLQIQVNSVDPDLLQKAYDQPEQYPHLIVRRGGYSVRFSDLSRAEQADLIQRFRNSSGQ